MQKGKEEAIPQFELYLYNAMTYNDVKSFGITLHADVMERFTC